jgi:hypothetical protein
MYNSAEFMEYHCGRNGPGNKIVGLPFEERKE